MNSTLPFFNWSLRKALNTEKDNLSKARIRIIYAMLLFSILKTVIVIVIGAGYHQNGQVARAAVACMFYVALTKLVLYKPQAYKAAAHVMVIIGIMIVTTSIFLFAHSVNLQNLQFVFMILLGSFYALGGRWGVFYSVLAVLPVLVSFFFYGADYNTIQISSSQFASTGLIILAILNFISLITVHYLFYNAFSETITEKERLNHQLENSITQANKLAATKSNFLSTMSHELRTPLNSVVGISELLLEDNPEERQKENLKILQLSARDLHALINNILDFNKLESDKLVLEDVNFRLDEFMQNICIGLGKKARDKQLDFKLEIDPAIEHTTIKSDPTRLSQLIYNLVGNAIKFTEHGSVIVRLSNIEKNQSQVRILFSVADTGIGISPDKHDSIFDLFTQAESHTTRKYGGTGLGLAIVKQVLGLFNSSLILESIPGEGSTFSFTITFDLVATKQNDQREDTPTRKNLSNLKILVAEDNDVNRLLIKKQLEKLNINATLAVNGKEAYSSHCNNDFDLILMDLHMPEMNGYETTKKIRSLKDRMKANVYIIAFTASISEQQEILDTGFDDYLYKPVNMTELYNKLEKAALEKQIITA